jgi:hypothetical protein
MGKVVKYVSVTATVHGVPGPGVLEGLAEAAKGKQNR